MAIVLEGIRGNRSVADICREHGYESVEIETIRTSEDNISTIELF